MKTSEVIGPALDCLVSTCEEMDSAVWTAKHFSAGCTFKPSTDWSQGGPIIEREKISVWARGNEWAAESFVPNQQGIEYVGPTPLIAAMRCYVASKLGDEVEIPEELR